MFPNRKWSAVQRAYASFAISASCLTTLASPGAAQSLTNPSFESPAVTANTDALRPTTATWTFSGQAGIRNNSAPNGSDGKQAAFLSAAPVSGNNNFGSVRQTVTLKPGMYYVRYLAAVKTPTGRPQPFQFYVNGLAQGGVLNPRYLTDTTTGGFEAGWTQLFVVTTAGSYELRFDATNATNYGTTSAPLYAVAYLDAVTLVSVPGAFANAGFESAGTWTLLSGATLTTATDAPEGTKVLSLAAAATATQTLALPAGQYSVSLKLGKASVATGTLNLEIASNGAAVVTVGAITATTAAEYRTYTTPAFALPSGNHAVTLRGSGSAFSVDAIALNDAAPDALNSGFETPILAAPSSATAAGPTVANPTNANWTFTGTGGLVQANAGTSNTSAPRTIAGKQYVALSGTGAVAQSLALAGGTYIVVGQVAQGGFNVLIDGTTVGKLAASTLDFREVMSAPFVVPAGTHSLGLTVDSTYAPNTPKLDEIRLLRVDVPPAVSITAPANGAVFQTGATVNITATASDPDGISALTIARTPTGGATTQLATSASSPLSTSWSNSSANGYTITASATDSTGATSATAISIRVNANPSAVVSVSPTGPMVTSATAVTATVIVSSATDSDGTVTKIEFLQDAVVATTCTKTIPPAVAPFTCALSLPPRAAAYALTVRVTDNDGGVTTTSPFTLRINTAPTVTLAAACVAPCTALGTINLTATPSDTDGTITKVEFYDGATLLAANAAAPWTFSHTTATAGSRSYTAKAFDNDNSSTTSTAQAITVAAPPPSVSVTAACTAPCNAPAAVTLTAVPANIVGTVSKVEFYDGVTLLNTDTTGPYSFAAASVAAATHSYTAKVYVTGTTAAVAMSTAQAVRVNALPTVTLTATCTAPCTAPASVTLTASPADADGTITKIEFYDGATLLATNTTAPWIFGVPSAASGSHSYTAKAYDNSSAVTTSTAQAITVTSPPPSVALSAACTAPCNAPAAVTLTAVPANIVGTVSKVEFYDGATLLNTDTASPYSFAVTAVSAATHSYTAKVYVTGTSPAVASSSAQAVRVNALPAVTLSAACVAPCSNPATVNLMAAPTDSDSTIARVEFYDGATLLATTASSPWTFSHATAAYGSHSYTAKAFDSDGASTTSTTQVVTVSAVPPSLTLTASCATPCTAPAAVTLSAVPANVAGTVSKVEFYDGATLINSDTTSPYSFVVSAAAAATHSYTSKVYVTGTTAAVANSKVQAVSVGAAVPSLTITATCAAPCTAPATVTVTATPSGITGTVNRIEFYDGPGQINTVYNAPYSYTAVTTAAGAHNFSARIFVSGTSAAVAVSSPQPVTVAGTAATLTLTATCSQPCSAPALVTLNTTNANITDPDAVTYLYADGVFEGASPGASISSRQWPVASGAHSYQIQIYSPLQGALIATSNVVNVTVTQPSTPAPSVNWVSPDNQAEINALGSFVLSVSASAASGTITGANFYADGALIGAGVLQGGNYSLVWQPPANFGVVTSSGSTTVRTFFINAVATDSLGVAASGAPRQLAVWSGIQFTPPDITTYYSDVNGFSRVEFPVVVMPTPQSSMPPYAQWNQFTTVFTTWIAELLENGMVVSSQKYGYESVSITQGNCSYHWNDAQATTCIAEWPAPIFVRAATPIGSYQYAVRITRSPGVIWQSSDTTITVLDSSPTVTITSPQNSASLYQGAVNIALTATATSVQSLTPFGYAEIFEGTTRLGNCLISSGTCTFKWLDPSLGAHTITARVTDDRQRVANSSPVTFNVLVNALPTVQVTAPATNAIFREPATVNVTATAADADGTISSVEFLNPQLQVLGNGVLNNGLYSFTISNILESERARHGVIVRATDNRGATGQSGVGFTVIGAPTSILVTRCTECYARDMLLDVYSNYMNFGGTQVRYQRDGINIGTVTGSNLSFIDRTGTAGTHVYRVAVTTQFGETALSAPVSVTLVDHAPPTVVIASPASGASFAATTPTIALRAVITQSDYDIGKVEFYRDGTVLLGTASLSGTDTYVLNWTGAIPGVYTLTARAIDVPGNVGTSLPITLTIIGGPQAAAVTAPVTGSEFPAAQSITVTAGGPTADPAITRIELWRVGTGAGGTDEMLTGVDGTTLSYALMLPASTTYVDLYTVALNAAGGRTPSGITTVLARTDVTDPRYFVWTNMNAALMAGNKAAAMAFLTPTAQDLYGMALNEVISQISMHTSSMVPGLLPISVSDATADYLVARDIGGTRLLFGIKFILMDDGRWKIDSM